MTSDNLQRLSKRYQKIKTFYNDISLFTISAQKDYQVELEYKKLLAQYKYDINLLSESNNFAYYEKFKTNITKISQSPDVLVRLGQDKLQEIFTAIDNESNEEKILNNLKEAEWIFKTSISNALTLHVYFHYVSALVCYTLSTLYKKNTQDQKSQTHFKHALFLYPQVESYINSTHCHKSASQTNIYKKDMFFDGKWATNLLCHVRYHDGFFAKNLISDNAKTINLYELIHSKITKQHYNYHLGCSAILYKLAITQFLLGEDCSAIDSLIKSLEFEKTNPNNHAIKSLIEVIKSNAIIDNIQNYHK
jgi:hypothetical protein